MHLCSICGKGFMKKYNCTSHEKKHSKKAPHMCCGLPFYSKSNLIRHECSVHGKEKSHVCPTCNKTFPTNADLRRHQRREKGDLKLTCHVCGYKTEDISRLRDHISKHTGEKQHRCQICNKSYGFSSGLWLHIKRKHSNS